MKAKFSATVPLLVLCVLACIFFIYREERHDYDTTQPTVAANEAASKEKVTNTPALAVEMPTATRESVKIEWTRPDHQPQVEAAPASGSEGESAEVVALRAEVQALRARMYGLEVELSVKSGQLAQWVELVRPEERPSQETLKTMAEYLHEYPVVLRYEEGLWLAERIDKKDWKNWGATVDEAIFTYLGEERLSKELTPEQFQRVKP